MRTFLRALRIICLSAILAAVAYAVGAAGYFRNPKITKFESSEAIPPPGLSLHGFGACVEPNEREQALVRAAVDVLEFPAAEAGVLSIGAQKFLSQGLYRGEGRVSTRVCDELEQYERAAQLIINSDHLRRGRIVEYGLQLIAKLPNPSEDLARLVAESAFNDSIQQSEVFRFRDIRPLARATLAGLGKHALPYATQAFEQISIKDSMGTGAAQIAVAGGHPMALHAVESAMANKLATLAEGRTVPWEIRNRLYEMAYALAYGGMRAKQHVAPLRDLMSRKVESWAPPFGMVELPPRRMCHVLASIMEVPVANLDFDYCTDTDAPYEQ